MLFFFYGTLMDRTLREALLGARARDLRVTPGTLLNHRRLAARHGDYPVLVPALGGRVSGVFVEGLDARALLWVAHFEGPEYLPGHVPAVDMDRRRLRPWTFLPMRRGYVGNKPWDFRRWQRIGRRQTRDALNSWLLERSVGSGVPLALDTPWRVRRTMHQIIRGSNVGPRPNPSLDGGASDTTRWDEGVAGLATAAE